MRLATNLPDVRILNLFDWVDVRCAGVMDFDTFFVLVALLFAVECGQSTHFLHLYGRVFFALCLRHADDSTLCYNRFSRLAYALGMTDDLIFGLLKQHGISSFPESIHYDRYQLYYFAILKNFDKVARAPAPVRMEWEETYSASAQCACTTQ